MLCPYNAVVTALKKYDNHPFAFDKGTRSKARGLLKSMTNFDFIFALMLMKNLMSKLKYMVECLQSESEDMDAVLMKIGSMSPL